MNKLHTTLALVAATISLMSFGAATFQDISFTQPTFSETDPLGVQALTTVTNEVKVIQTVVSTIDTKVENAVKSQMTNNTNVVIGQVKGTEQDIGLVAKNNSILVAVNRDMEETQGEENTIKLSADKIVLDSTKDTVFVGAESLTTILSNAGQGEVNAIVGIQTNGTDVAIDPSNRKVNITIPQIPTIPEVPITSIKVNESVVTPVEGVVSLTIPTEVGDKNVIETIKVNGTALTPSEKAVDITVPSIDDLATTNFVNNELTKYVKSEGLDVGDKNVIESIKVNGTALTITDKAVDITVPSTNGFITADALTGYATTSHTHTAKEIGLSDAAITATNEVTSATDIAELKAAMNKFLQQFIQE